MIPTQSSREQILKKIEATRKRRSEDFFPAFSGSGKEIYKPILPDVVACFKNELETVKGQCVLCENENDLYHKMKDFVVERAFPFVFSRDQEILSRMEENAIPCSDKEADFENM